MRQDVFVGLMLLLATTLSLTSGLGASARGGAAAAPHISAAPHMAAPHMAAPRQSAPVHMGRAQRPPEQGHLAGPVRMSDLARMPGAKASHLNEHIIGPASLQSAHQDSIRRLESGGGSRSMPRDMARGGMPIKGRTAAAVAGAAALGGLAARHMGTANDPSSLGRGTYERGGMGRGSIYRGAAHNAQIRSDVQGAKGTRGTHNVPPAPGFANPRRFFARGGDLRFDQKEPGQRLSYRQSASMFPQGGDRGKGVPGVYDPGGYVRTPQSADTRIKENYARQQCASFPDWQGSMAFNGQNVINNRGAWPWQLPAQPTWWNPFSWSAGGIGGGYPYGGVNPYWGNPYAEFNPYFGYPYGVTGDPYFWNSWNTFADWNHWNDQYSNVAPGYWGNSGLFGMLGNVFDGPAGVGVGSGNPNDWLSNLLYFNGYSINGQAYPANYFAMNGYVPTPYVFNVAQGQFWQPGVGYADYLPPTYQSPITASVQEVVPTFNRNNAITGYQPQTFYYNAFWDNNAQSFGYYDYRKKFHWLTFPWLPSYSQRYVEH